MGAIVSYTFMSNGLQDRNALGGDSKQVQLKVLFQREIENPCQNNSIRIRHDANILTYMYPSWVFLDLDGQAGHQGTRAPPNMSTTAPMGLLFFAASPSSTEISSLYILLLLKSFGQYDKKNITSFVYILIVVSR